MSDEERRALIVHLRQTLAAVIRSDWANEHILVRLLKRLESEQSTPPTRPVSRPVVSLATKEPTNV